MSRRSGKATVVTAGVVAVAAISGCGDTAQGIGVQVRDSSGVEVVEVRPDVAQVGSWRADSVVLRLGTPDGDGPHVFHRIAGVLYGQDEIIVADGGSGQIRWFDRTGEHVATAGTTGEGPGEFRSLAWIGRGVDGEVIAWDPRLRRVSTFRNGEFRADVRPPFPEDRAFPVVHGLLPDGALIATPGAVYIPEDEPGVQRPRMPIWVVPLEEPVLDTVGIIPGQAVNLRPARNQAWIRTVVPFGPTTLVAPAGEHIVVGDNAQYELRYLRPDGVVERVVRVSDEPRPVTEEDLAGELERRLEGMPPVEEIRAGIRAMFEETPAAESMPAFVTLLGDRQGNVWVRRTEQAGEWDIFDKAGRLVARAELPADFMVAEVAGNLLVGVEKDELGVEYVVVRRISKGG